MPVRSWDGRTLFWVVMPCSCLEVTVPTTQGWSTESWFVMSEIEDAKAFLESEGYVVLKKKSYDYQLQRRRIAETRLEFEKEAAEATRQWALAAFEEQRRLADRLVYVYGVARAHGASVEELS